MLSRHASLINQALIPAEACLIKFFQFSKEQDTCFIQKLVCKLLILQFRQSHLYLVNVNELFFKTYLRETGARNTANLPLS